MLTSVIMGAGERPELGEEPGNCFCRTKPGVARTFARTMFHAIPGRRLVILNATGQVGAFVVGHP